MNKAKLIILATLITGWAHGNGRGSVAMKVSDTEAHIDLGDGEVKTGDRIALFKNECKPSTLIQRGVDNDPSCEKVRIGEGTVLKTLNRDYSVVKVQPGVSFEEGTIVEKW